MNFRACLVVMVVLAVSGAFSVGGKSASMRSGGTSVSGSRVTSPIPRLAVRQIGVHARRVGHRLTNASWGVALANPSRSKDALDVTIHVALLGADGKVIPHQGRVVNGETIPVIPAGQTVYLGGDYALLGDVDVRHVRMNASIGTTKPKSSVLPPVTEVLVNASTGKVTGTVTNPYRRSMDPHRYRATAVFYDRRGRVIGGSQRGSFASYAELEPGARTSVSFPVSGAFPGSRLGSARITVSPL
jgi:hypothetical protein